jgi:hypothetical protein
MHTSMPKVSLKRKTPVVVEKDCNMTLGERHGKMEKERKRLVRSQRYVIAMCARP